MAEPTDVRKRLFIILGIAAGIILALFLFIAVIRDTQPAEAPGGETATTTGAVPTPLPPPPPPPAAVIASQNGTPEDIYLKQLATIFVERFGSYSNQNDNQHIADVLPLATVRMQEYLESQSQESARIYAGVTTNVVASRISEKSGNTAMVAVDVQRIIREPGGERTEYASGKVVLKNVNNEWKVDGLFWE